MRLTQTGHEVLAAFGLSSCWSARYRAGGQDHLADVLIMGVAGLDLLRDGVHVAKAALEWVGPEHSGGAGHVIGGIDHRGRLMDRPGRGEAKRRTVVLGELARVGEIAPALGCRRVEIGPRRA